MHHANTILALGAGKPVLCEKVFSINAKEAQEMIDCAKKNNVMVMEAMWARFVPHMIKVREKLAVTAWLAPPAPGDSDDVCFNGNHDAKDGRCVVDGGRKPGDSDANKDGE